MSINPETMYWAEQAISMASKAAAIREAYRDAKAVGKKVSKSLSRAHRVVRKQTGKAMPRINIKKTVRQTKHQLLRDVRNRHQLGRDRARATARAKAAYKPSGGSLMNRMSRFSTKKRKPRKLGSAGTVKRHFDDYGTIKRDHVLWAGFQDHGSHDRMFDILGESVTKAMLARIKVYPVVYDKPLNTGLPSNACLVLDFKRVNGSGQALTASSTIINIQSKTFKTLSDDVTGLLNSYANGSISNPANSTTDRVAYYLYAAHFKDTATSIRYGHIENFDLAMIDINVFCKTKLQNITKNIDNSNDLDRVGTNPISGKKYSLRSQTARLVSQIQASDNSKYDDFCQTHGGVNGVVAVQQLDVDDALAHPPAARSVFTNCYAVQNVSIPAGGTKFDNTTFKMRCSMRKFIERLYDYGIDRSSFGKCTWYCFERTHRQAETGSVELNDVKLAFNREVIMSASCTLKRPMPMLKHYDNSDLGSSL